MDERLRQTLCQLVLVGDPEQASLATRIDGLEHGGKPNRLKFPRRLALTAQHREVRLWDLVLAQAYPHRGLVGHHSGGGGADPRQPETVGDGRRDRHGAVSRNRHDRVDLMAESDLDHPLEVGEVYGLGDVCGSEADSLWVGVDGDHPPT
jgi:hypothetical protein